MASYGGQLADELRSLKDRVGASYDALGRRLNTSGSTLHPYCSGAAVPSTFYVVEQLAKHAGADADEVARLRRLWELAAAPPPAATAAADAEAPKATLPLNGKRQPVDNCVLRRPATAECGYGMRATPAYTAVSAAVGRGSGSPSARHSANGTTPGATGSSPSKNMENSALVRRRPCPCRPEEMSATRAGGR
jgi:hypothetical protein